MDHTRLLELTAGIVSATHMTATVSAAELITEVYGALAACGQGPAVAAAPERPEPAVSIRASIKPDHLVCLEDGAKLKMLKRYLRTNFDMSPEDYREKWGLPKDYPMVAPAYAERRREIAVAAGLGRKPASAAKPARRAKAA